MAHSNFLPNYANHLWALEAFHPPLNEFLKRRQKKSNMDYSRKKGLKTVDGVSVRTIFIGNLPLHTTEQDLMHKFGNFGHIMKIDVIRTNKYDKREVFGFVTFNSPSDAARALFAKRRIRLNSQRLFINSADSWHQPIERPDGSIIWDRRFQNHRKDRKVGEGCDDEELDAEEDMTESDIQDVSVCPIMKLNDDCLRAVFSYIPFKERHKLSLVCHRWQAINSVMWSSIRKLDFSVPPFSDIPLTLPVLKCLLAACSNLTHLNLCQESHTLDSTALAVVAKYCQYLEELSFSNINLFNRSLALLARSCHNLKVFHMDGCLNCHDGEMISILEKCPQLKDLHMRYSMSLSGKWLKFLKGPIESLSLQMCEFNPDYLIKGIQTVGPTMKKLTLVSCLTMRCNDIKMIVASAPNITSLTISGSFPLFKTYALTYIIKLKNLTELDLERNVSVSDELIEGLVENCPNLELLNLSATDTSTMSSYGLSLLSKFTKMVCLELAYLSKLHDSNLRSIAQKCTKLKLLRLAGCSSVSDEGCCSIVSLCNNLEVFDVSGCILVTNNTIKAAIQAGQMEGRKQLSIIIGGSGVNFDKELESPFVIINPKTTCIPFMSYDDNFFVLEDMDDEDNFVHYPHDDLYDVGYLDFFGIFEGELDAISSSDETDESEFEFF